MASSTTAKQSPATQAQRRARQQWWRTVRFPAFLISLLVLVIALVVYFQLSLVVGTELNSKTWQVREFRFRRDPFTHYQITGIQYAFYKQLAPARLGQAKSRVSNLVSSDEDSLDPSIKKLFKPQDSIPERWDLVEIRDSTTGQASILLDLVDAKTSDYSNFWILWTQDHPNEAAVLWPAVHDLVSVGKYASLPELMERALRASDLEDLKKVIQRIVQTDMLNSAKQSKSYGDLTTAKAIASLGLQYGEDTDLESFLSDIGES